jgi:hypothetical protein
MKMNVLSINGGSGFFRENTIYRNSVMVTSLTGRAAGNRRRESSAKLDSHDETFGIGARNPGRSPAAKNEGPGALIDLIKFR